MSKKNNNQHKSKSQASQASAEHGSIGWMAWVFVAVILVGVGLIALVEHGEQTNQLTPQGSTPVAKREQTQSAHDTSQVPDASTMAAPQPPMEQTVEIPNPATKDTQPQVLEMIEGTRDQILDDPTSPIAWARLARVCDAHQLYDCAVKCYRQASRLSPESFEPLYFLAIMLNEGFSSAEAIDVFRQAEKLLPEYPPLQIRLGMALEAQNQPEAARDAYLRAIELTPAYGIAHRNLGQVLLSFNDNQSAIEHLELAASYMPGDSVVFSALAQAYRRTGRLEASNKAVEHASRLERAFLREPLRAKIYALATDSVTLLNRATKAIHAGRFEEAIPDLKKCARAQPKDTVVLIYLATCYKQTSKLELATAQLLHAIQTAPESIVAHAELATVLILRGELEAGMKHYRKALSIEPQNHRIPLWVAAPLAQHDHLFEAVDAFELAASKGAIDGRSHTIWAGCLLKLSDYEGAVEHNREALGQLPDSADAHFNLANSLERLGLVDEALQMYARAVEIDPSHTAADRLMALENRIP